MKLKDLLTEVLTEGALYKTGQLVQYQLDKGSQYALKPSSGKISKVQKVGNYYQYTIMDGGPVPVWEIEILQTNEDHNTGSCNCTPETIVKEVCGPFCKGKKWVGKKLGLSKGQM